MKKNILPKTRCKRVKIFAQFSKNSSLPLCTFVILDMSYNCKLSQYRIRFVLNWMVSSLAYTTTTVCCKIRKKVQFDEIIPHLPQMGKSKFFLLRKFRAVSPNTYLKLHFFPILMLIVQAFGHLHR